MLTKKNRYLILSVALILALMAIVQLKQGAAEPAKEVFSKQTVRYGAASSDVYELQGRLKYLGFYAGKVDGIYGWRTLKSVKWFQGEFGLKADGIVAGKTKLKLWEATKNWRPTGAYRQEAVSGAKAAPGSTASSHPGISENDIKIMSNAVFGESRGEPYRGQVAVAAVILNRVGDSNFPTSVSGVIFQPGAFTAVADGQIWLTPNDTARRAVQDAINGVDPTNGCTYYFNPVTATSKWIWSRPQVMKIGKHIFCK